MASLLAGYGKMPVTAVCRACTSAQNQSRLFSYTSSTMVGPESPNYIDVPRSIQPDFSRRKQLKGTLPVPREIFPPRRPDKPTESYIAEATPKPLKDAPKVTPDHPQFEQLEWKRKMAEKRRQHLREGLLELYARKKQNQQTMVAKSSAKQRRREEILHQAQREDERLTATTTVSTMEPFRSAVLPDPNGDKRLEDSVTRTEDALLSQREHKMDSIHTLYMNARNFIVNEAQLNAEIEKVFPAEANPDWQSVVGDGTNIWNLGAPPTMAALGNQAKDQVTKWEQVQRRTKNIAEALTGGKI
ncbi:hypothetical protein FQN57_005688 [Myotisia sp. PD_48]|nr:hypothetical protein FQN57_005688 [Myotisia sp. PD_48]